MRSKVILVTCAACGVGRLTANALAQSGHTVYAAMRETGGGNARQVAEAADYARSYGVDLHVIELDVLSQQSVDDGVADLIAVHGRIDVVVHNAGHMAFGPAEAFTPEQFTEFYDVNVVGAQRVNRAALPHMRSKGEGLLVWVSSSGVAGGTLPYLSLCLAAAAGMDALAVQYARELALWGIETSIVVAGAFMRGANQLAHATRPGDQARVEEYEAGPCAGFIRRIPRALARIVPQDADAGAVAGAIAEIVDTPFGERPFRVHVDPSQDGGAVAFAVIDRVREEMLHRAGFDELLRPRARS